MPDVFEEQQGVQVAEAEGARGTAVGEGNLEAMGRTEFDTERSGESWEGGVVAGYGCI